MGNYLNVFFHQEHLGVLKENDGNWSFAYTAHWLERVDSFYLSPHLYLRKEEFIDDASEHCVKWYFENFLPNGENLELFCKKKKLNKSNRFAILSKIEQESAGALSFTTSDKIVIDKQIGEEISKSELSKRIKELPKDSLNRGNGKMSIAGAQHKMLVHYNVKSNKIYEPTTFLPSNYILKPNNTNSKYSASVANEYLIMKVATQCGLSIPQIKIDFVPEPIYLIERFDRDFNKNNTNPKKHIIDGCQLLNLSPENKDTAGLEELKKIIDLTKTKAKTRLAIFKWLIFNIIIGNDDCHLKNISFFVAGESVEIAPFYDLLSTCVYHTTANTDVEQGKQGDWDKVDIPYLNGIQYDSLSFKLLVDIGVELGVKKKESIKMINKIILEIEKFTTEDYLKKIINQYEAIGKDSMERSLFFIRMFVHIIRKDNLKKLELRDQYDMKNTKNNNFKI